MMNEKHIRLMVLLLMLVLACLYVDSHVQHDLWMTQRIADQQNQIDYLLKHIKRLEEDK